MLSVACDSMKNEKLPGQVHGQTFVLIMGHGMADGAWRAVISNLPEKGHPPTLVNTSRPRSRDHASVYHTSGLCCLSHSGAQPGV
jgi:hypothetical protein